SGIATVTISINPVNDSNPVAVADSFTVNEGGTANTLDGGATKLTANDIDLDLPNDNLTVVLVGAPQHAAIGGFILNADGTFSYTHNGNSAVSDSFVYRVTDAVGHSTSTAVVSITIVPVNNNAPTAVGETIQVNEGGIATTLVGGANKVLAND